MIIRCTRNMDTENSVFTVLRTDMWNLRAAEITGIDKDDLHSISCHIGGGVTVAASIGCVGIDTSLGYGTVCGVPMGTRSGDVDPDVILNMIDEQGISAKDVKNIIYKKSGLAGISGVSSDLRDIINAADKGNERADLALRIFFTVDKTIYRRTFRQS